MRNIFLILLNVLILTSVCSADSIYKGKVVDLYDADTFTVVFNLGFGITKEEKVRLYGIDCPELRTKNLLEKKHGYIVKDYTVGLIVGKKFTFVVGKKGKFGRYLVDLKLLDGVSLTDKLIDEGYCKAYFGEKKTPWVFD